MEKFLMYIIAFSIILALLPLTEFWAQKPSESTTHLSNTPFFIAHVIAPDSGFPSWKCKDWMQWLNEREKKHMKVSPSKNNRMPLPEKDINSVVISTSPGFMNAFGDGRQPYGSWQRADGRGVTPNGIYWGDTLFASFVFQRHNRKQLRLYACPPMYIAVKFVNGVPVHFQQHAKLKDRSSRIKLSQDCERICVF